MRSSCLLIALPTTFTLFLSSVVFCRIFSCFSWIPILNKGTVLSFMVSDVFGNG